MNLSTLKKEAREEAARIDEISKYNVRNEDPAHWEALMLAQDTLIDKVVEATQEAVKLDYENSVFANQELEKKFTNFKK